MKVWLTTAGIAVKLVRNGLRYRYLRLTGRPGRPQAISLEVTHSCVCRCVMCNIWKIPRSLPDLSLEEWVSLLSEDLLSDLRELDITGGEPFLRDDLVALMEAVRTLKDTRLPRLRSVAITTNGVLSDRVVGMVAEMLEPPARDGLELVIVCALDAVGELHDEIRRYPGAWSRVDRSIAGLLELRDRHPNLVVGVKTTVIRQNLGELEKIAAYARERDLFTIISPAIVTPGRYLNQNRERDLTLSAAECARLASFYEGEGGDSRWSYHGQTLARYLRTGCMDKPCTCGFNYFFVRSNGELFLCPLFEKPLGNVKDAPLA
ncbi:MAG: radical SAM protein, partial [Actinomycetia bacterium]|nr:radical SAM protein [Actinomycetes bacterium]